MYHLELGSEGHSFHGKAIVVNSQTGEHKSSHPIPLENAKAQMRVLEAAHKEESAPEPAPKKKFVIKKKPAPEPAPKKIVSPVAIEEWLENMVKIDLVEEGIIADLGKEADDYIKKLQDEGEYGDILEESLSGRGHEDVAEMIYNHFLKHGNSPKRIKDSMRELIQDGYSMFEELVK